MLLVIESMIVCYEVAGNIYLKRRKLVDKATIDPQIVSKVRKEIYIVLCLVLQGSFAPGLGMALEICNYIFTLLALHA